MIIIADAHINSNRNTTEDFFQMLEKISSTSYDVVFLGDIFELWIALDRYEDRNHKRFLDWCRTEKQNRIVGYVEGNHELFITQEHSESFTWCEPRFKFVESLQVGFCHGDRLDPSDWKYRLFRFATTNPISKMMAKYLPFAPSFVNMLKRKMTNTNKERGYIPKDTVKRYADNTLCDKLPRIFTGHFHLDYSYKKGEYVIHSLPDWMATGKVSFYNEATGFVDSRHWNTL